MKTARFVLALAFILASVGQAQSYSGVTPFPGMAKRTLAQVWKGLEACGLYNLDAFDPRLPPPHVPAQRAIVNSRGQLLAYYLEDFGFGFYAEFKNPNGGYGHSVGFDNYGIQFVTPYGGTVAHGNKYATVGGIGTNTYCYIQPVVWPAFENCALSEWAAVITRQLCQFATSP